MLKNLKKQLKEVFKVTGKNGINIQVDIDEHSFIGDKISIIGNKVNVNGVNQGVTLSTKGNRPLKIVVHGDVNELYTSSGDVRAGNINTVTTEKGDIECKGVIKDINTLSGDVDCGAVGGNINTTTGDVDCEYVMGDIRTSNGDIIVKRR